MASANVLREEEDEAELWSVSKSRQRAAARQSNQTASIFAFAALGGLLVVMLLMRNGQSGGAGGVFPIVSPEPGAKQGLLSRAGDSIAAMVRDSAPVTLHHDFGSGWSDWTTAAVKAGSKVDDPHDWKVPTIPTVVPSGKKRFAGIGCALAGLMPSPPQAYSKTSSRELRTVPSYWMTASSVLRLPSRAA